MNLAYKLDEYQSYKVKDEAQEFVDKIVNLGQYKDAKNFVDLVNNKKIFIQALFLLELLFRTQLKSEEDSSIDSFLIALDIFDKKVNEIKNNQNKVLKKKYLHMDAKQLLILGFIKQRYYDLKNMDLETKEEIKNIIKDAALKTKENSEAEIEVENKYQNLPRIEYMKYHLGVSYCFYKNFNADILSPIVKNIIKDAVEINKKYNLKTEFNHDFKTLNRVTSKIYKKALEELAK